MDESSPKAVATPESARTRRRRRGKRLAIILLVTAALYTLIGFVGVPLLIHKVILPRLEQRLTGTLTLEKARFNPFTFTLRLHGAVVKDAGGAPVAGFEGFEGSFRPIVSIYKPGWRFGPATITSPYARPEIARDGKLNLAALVKPPAQPGSPVKKIPHVYIERLSVKAAQVAFADHSLPAPFSAQWQDIDLTVEPVDTAAENPIRLSAVSKAGESATWSGSAHVNPPSSTGQLQLKGIDLAQFMPYGMRHTPVRLAAGTADISIEYDVAPVKQQPVAVVKIPTLRIAGAKLRLNDRPLADAQSLELTGVAADAAARSLSVENLRITSPTVFARREAGGAFEITSAIVASTTGTTTGTPGAARVDPLTIEYPVDQLLEALTQLLDDATGAWSIKVEKIEIADGTGTYADASTRAPVEIGLAKLSITAGPLGSAEQWKVPFEAGMQIGEGQVQATGQIALRQQTIEAQLKGGAIPLGPFGPYLPNKLPAPLATMDLSGGALAVDGLLSATLTPSGPKLKYNGDLRLSDLRFVRPDSAEAGVFVKAIHLAGASEVDIGQAGLERLATDSDAQVESLSAQKIAGAPIELKDGVAVDPQSATLDAKGKLTATLDAASNANATWSGQTRLSDVRISKPGGSSLVSLGSLDVQGDLTAEAPAGAETRLKWKGTTGLQSLEGESPDGQYKIATTTADAAGDLEVQLAPSGDANIGYRGRASVGDLKASRAAPERAVDIRSIRLEGVDFKQREKAATVEEVLVDGSDIKAVIELMPPPGEKSEQPPMARLGSSIPYDVHIGTVKLTDGQLELSDPAATPPTTLSADQINVEIRNFATHGGEATVDASTRLQRLGKTTLTGTLDATSQTPSADLMLNISSLGLKPFDPIAARFVGYLIESGRMTVQMPIKLVGNEVSGELDFTFDNLHLGQSMPSPDAPGIPVKLGLDLLRDPNDRITGKVPFEGDVSDPGFRFSRLIWQAFFGFLGKAVTAPFNLIGSLFGAAEGQDVSRVVFDPGSAELNAKALSNTDIIGKAMRERPSISLVVVGCAGGEGDIKALKATLLREAILRRVQARDNRVQTLTDSRYKSEMDGQYKDVLGEPRTTDADGRGRWMTFEEMEASLLEHTQVPPDRLAELAKQRADAVINELTRNHGVASERVRAGEPAPGEKPTEEPIAEFRVE